LQFLAKEYNAEQLRISLLVFLGAMCRCDEWRFEVGRPTSIQYAILITIYRIY